VACRKQKRVQNHPTLMKSNTITALALAAGFLTTAAFADNPPTIPAFTPTPITPLSLAPTQIVFTSPLPGGANLVRIPRELAFTINWNIPSARDLSVPGRFANWRPKTVSDQMLSDADASPSELATAIAVSARPPPTVTDYDPFAKSYRDPPVFFRVTFNFGHSRGS
jgi:hypothetical protein